MSTSLTQHGLLCPTCGEDTKCNLSFHESRDPHGDETTDTIEAAATDDSDCCHYRRASAREVVIRHLQLDAA